MRKITVLFDLKLPTEADDDQIHEWLEFKLGANGSISNTNPLTKYGIEAESCSVEFEDA